MTDKELNEMCDEIVLLKGRVKCLEELENLHEQQIGVLKQFIESYLMMNIKTDGSHHGRK